MKGGATNNPVIQYNTVETSKHGLYIAGNATVDYCDFKNSNTNHSINFSSSSTVNLDGQNNICPAGGYYAINNRSGTTTDAENNWWGTSSPTDALFVFPAYVDYSPYRASAASAGVYKTIQETDPLEMAEQHEFSGDFDNALDEYKSVLMSESDPDWRQFVITSMLRVIDKHDTDYEELRTIIENEMKSAEGYNGAVLRFIVSDIDIREGNYQKAIDDLTRNAKFYGDTFMEAEMLGRVAEIYGLYLNDKTQALQYAQKAETVNPGQFSLRSAFNAAGIDYETALYEDRFENADGSYNTPQDFESETSGELSNSVAVSPNPFNPVTTISYSLVEPGHVTLTIFNISGQRVATLVNGNVPAGQHSASFNGDGLASGIYFYRLDSPAFSSNGKMLLMK